MMTHNIPVQCGQCHKLFSNALYLRQHTNLRHSASNEDNSPLEKRRCGQMYLTQEEYYEKRAAIRNGENIILCRYCNHIPFKSKRYLFQHVTIMHSPDGQNANKRKANNVLGSSDSEIIEEDRPAVVVSPETTEVPQVKRNFGSWTTTQKYNVNDGRKSYSNGFKASVIEEIDKGTSRRTLSIAYDIPIRTMEKWVTRDHDVLLTCRKNVDVAGFTRVVRKTYGEKMYSDSRRRTDSLDSIDHRRQSREEVSIVSEETHNSVDEGEDEVDEDEDDEEEEEEEEGSTMTEEPIVVPEVVTKSQNIHERKRRRPARYL